VYIIYTYIVCILYTHILCVYYIHIYCVYIIYVVHIYCVYIIYTYIVCTLYTHILCVHYVHILCTLYTYILCVHYIHVYCVYIVYIIKVCYYCTNIYTNNWCKFIYYTSGGTWRYPGWVIAKAAIWNHMEGQRLDRLDVICITSIPYSLPSHLMRFGTVDTWIPFTSQRIVRITDSATHLE
jgi:hypothetical protein